MTQPPQRNSTCTLAMANDKAATLLTSLPLEVRHTIFDYAAARKTKPKKLLRYWFEKKEAKELVAKYVADNPNDPAPQVVYHQEPDVDSDVPEPEPDEDEDEDDGDEDGENEDEEDGEDGEEDGEDNGNGENEENEDDEVDQDGGMHDIGDAEGSEEQPMEANDDSHIVGTGTTPQAFTSTPAQALPSQASHTPQISAQPGSDDHNADDVSVISEDHAEVDAETQDDDGDQVMADEDDEYARNEEEGDDEEDATDATAAAVPPPAVVISSHHKWRHIPNFMRISHCPPPVELLLASKQLNEEAKNWFYDVAVLRVSATSSFAHTSFFEEAFSQITEAAFSPMENIRKVEVLFVWDTTWLRAEETGCAEAIFPALLRQRADFVHQILSQAPDLREVTVHWHDSAEDNESANFMLDILAPFHSLNANMQIKEHYIAANTKPHKNSIAGQRRLEFQRIVDAGLDRLF